MKLAGPLIRGKLIKRYKRFLADVQLETGEMITAHCPNSGSMLGLDQAGSPVLLSHSTNPKRKFPLTWELVLVAESWVVVNTLLPNRLVRDALLSRQIPDLAGYDSIKPEATWKPGCRFDFLLQSASEKCFVEVKSVTLAQAGIARFPDAVTERGRKHLLELTEVEKSGQRAVLLFLVGRQDCNGFEVAHEIDPAYATALENAVAAGVEILVFECTVAPPEILISAALKFHPRQTIVGGHEER